MPTKNLHHTIDAWIMELERYSLPALCARPSANSWSIGQVYMHCIDQTRYYLEQVKLCMATNDDSSEPSSPAAKEMFLANALPDTMIEGPAENGHTLQPSGHEELLQLLLDLKRELDALGELMSDSDFTGKTKHPGLHYFSAAEWLQFADMHFRHHERQKKRIDGFLSETPGLTGLYINQPSK